MQLTILSNAIASKFAPALIHAIFEKHTLEEPSGILCKVSGQVSCNPFVTVGLRSCIIVNLLQESMRSPNFSFRLQVQTQPLSAAPRAPLSWCLALWNSVIILFAATQTFSGTPVEKPGHGCGLVSPEWRISSAIPSEHSTSIALRPRRVIQPSRSQYGSIEGVCGS